MAKKSKARAKKSSAGRPRKIDEKIVGKLVEGFRNDFTVEEACRYAGISKDCYYEQCKRDSTLADEMSRAQDFPFILAKKRLVRGMNAVDGADLSLKFLERRQRDRYSPKIIQEHTGKVVVGHHDLETVVTKATSPQEAKRMAEKHG